MTFVGYVAISSSPRLLQLKKDDIIAHTCNSEYCQLSTTIPFYILIAFCK